MKPLGGKRLRNSGLHDGDTCMNIIYLWKHMFTCTDSHMYLLEDIVLEVFPNTVMSACFHNMEHTDKGNYLTEKCQGPY